MRTPLNPSLEMAQRVAKTLNTDGIAPLVIGATALAFHHYPRLTADIDLAVSTDPARLQKLGEALAAEGLEVAFSPPDGNDPLGGVLDVRAPGADLVQVVNFLNPPAGGYPRLVERGLERSVPLIEGTDLRIVDLFTLIAFKLYAGGGKSVTDILELLERNQPIDLAALRRECKELRLDRALERVLEMAGQ